LRSRTLAALGDATGPPLRDLLGRLTGSDRIAHALNLRTADAIRPQFSEERPKMMLDLAAIGFQRGRLLMPRALAQIQIGQLREGQRPTLLLANRLRVAAGGDLREQPLGLVPRLLRCPGRAVLADREPPLRRTPTRPDPVIDRVGFAPAGVTTSTKPLISVSRIR
jgi:hypothetical protein